MAQKASAKKTVKKAPAKKAAAPKARSKPGKAARPAPARKMPAPKAKPAAKPVAKAQGPVVTKPEKPIKTNLGKADLQYFRNLLLEKRREILGDVGSMESEAFKTGSNLSNMPIHMADVGTDNFEQEFTLGLIESERQILREIQEALVRIDEGTFGICQGTGKPINRVRLEAVPWTKYCMEYAKALESGQIRRENSKSQEEEAGEDEEE